MSRYLISALEQALWSVLNFGVNLLLIRFVPPDQYGAFVFWASCGFVLSSVQNALTVCHLQVLPPGDGRSPERLPVERLMHAVNLVFLLTVGLGCLVGALAYLRAGSPYGALASAVFVPAYLLQQYIRALAFSRGRVGVAATQTGLVFLLVVALLGGAMALHQALNADRVMLCIGAAYAVVGVAGALWATAGQGRLADLGELATYGAYARQSGWIFLGVSSTELLTRFYVFVVAGWYGPAALASLSATQQLLRPIPLLASSWAMVARADLARRREAGDWGGFARIVLLALAGGVVVAGVWTFGIVEAWPLVAAHLFGGKYGDDSWMVLLWGASAALGFGQVVVSAALQSLKAFKALALANAAASVAAAGMVLLMMRALGYGGAIVGTGAGQLLELAVMAATLAATVAARKAPGPARP
jgi:O-antigen/teichoic acid export membrane protein